MRKPGFYTLRTFAAAAALALTLSGAAVAQDNNNQTAPQSTVASGQKAKLKGFVVSRGSDSFVVQDYNGARTTVVLTDRTSVKTKGGAFSGGTTYGQTAIMRGLNLEIEGRGDANGQLVAEKIRFGDRDLRAAKTLEANVVPVENRVGQSEARIGEVEQNAQRMSGQVDELAAVSNAARGGATAAQETADRAVEGVRVANDRIGALDDFTPEKSINVTFKNRSAVLSPEAKETLDQVAQFAQTAKGYLIEVTGYAYEYRGRTAKNANRQLSERRAETIVRYLVENHNVPLRRIVTPFGYGAANPIADNATREGRAENRRAEVRVLVNRGLTQPGADTNPTRISTATPE
ncbi:MAG TPA: OmpA family protein [Pyrinomonadaceae bacterium]|nr:OmpA family protein [Pyrinomonadaceae bacterium]